VKVWEVVQHQPNTRVLKAKWISTGKFDEKIGKRSQVKARWVANGFSQLEGVDYNKLYASVANVGSIQIFSSLVNNYVDLNVYPLTV
jgi:hypothetical protein